MAQENYPCERTPVHTEWEAGWGHRCYGRFWRRENYLLLLGFEPWTIHPVARHYTNHVILALTT